MRPIVHIHVPKTGGTWLNNVLSRNLPKGYWLGGEHLAVAGGIETVSEWRPDAETCVDEADARVQLVTGQPKYPGRWRNALKVSVCRNPFDLLVSYYCHEEPHPTKRIGHHEPHPGWAWAWEPHMRREGVPSGWDCINITHGTRSFDEFIKKFCDTRFKWHHGLRRNNLFYQMFNHDGNCGVDVIIRNENLTSAIQVLLVELEYVERNSTFAGALDRSNVTEGKKDYRSFYTDELRELVEKKCAQELEMFEYNFDGPTNDNSFIDPVSVWYHQRSQVAMKNGQRIV